MIVTVKRFDMFGRKISRRIKYPTSFNLKRHMNESVDLKNSSNSQSANIPDQYYDLYGVVIHAGATTSCGHYYSFCKIQSQGGKWYECDDSTVR